MALLQQQKALQQAAHYTLELQRPKGKLSKSARQKKVWNRPCRLPGSNWRPPDYETDALTN